MASTFAQFVFTLPKPGKDIVLELSLGWDTLRPSQRTITQVEMRRTLKIMETPARVIVPASDQENYAAILALGEGSKAHIERFEAQAVQHKQDKANRKMLASIAAFLKG